MIPISGSLSSLICDQVAREIGNKHLYRQFSSWAHVRGLKNISKFFAGESEGEQSHADLLMKLLDTANVEIYIPDVPAKPANFTGCEQIAHIYEAAEAETTDFLEAIYRTAEAEGNIGVSNVLQGMLEEQIEEQGLTERFGQLVILAGSNLVLLDLAMEV